MPASTALCGEPLDQHAPQTPNLSHHARVYILADKYVIDTLKDHALGRFKKDLTHWWWHDDLAEAAWVIYEETLAVNHPIRDALLGGVFKWEGKVLSDAMKEVFIHTLLARDVEKKWNEERIIARSSARPASPLLPRLLNMERGNSSLPFREPGSVNNGGTFGGTRVRW